MRRPIFVCVVVLALLHSGVAQKCCAPAEFTQHFLERATTATREGYVVVQEQRSVEYLSLPLGRFKGAALGQAADGATVEVNVRLVWSYDDADTVWYYTPDECSCHNDTDVLRPACLNDKAVLVGSATPVGFAGEAFYWTVYDDSLPYNLWLQNITTTAKAGLNCLVSYKSTQWIRGFSSDSAKSSVTESFYTDFQPLVANPDRVFAIPAHCPTADKC